MVKLRNRLLIGLLLIVAAISFSCDGNVAGPRFKGDTYSLAALLMVGSPIDNENPVFLTKSNNIEEFEFTELFVTDAIIKIYELSGNDTTAVIELQPVLDMGQNDQLTVPKIKYVDLSGYIVKANQRYRIEAEIPGYDKLVWAETVTPKQVQPVEDFNNLNIEGEGYSLNPATTDSISFDDLGESYPLAVNTGDFTGSLNMYLEIYCLEEFSTDLEFTIPIFGITYADSSIAWIYNSSGDSMRRIRLFAKYLALNYPEAGGNHALLRDFKQGVAFYGRYRFTIYSIDDNYYRFLYNNEGYLNGGVHNALGYFGSASGAKLYTRVVKS